MNDRSVHKISISNNLKKPECYKINWFIVLKIENKNIYLHIFCNNTILY